VVEVLLHEGADKEAKDKGSWTPLHHAAIQGHAAVVEVLVRAGADKEAKTGSGATILGHAILHGRAAVAEFKPDWSLAICLPIVDAFRTFVTCPPPAMHGFQSLMLGMAP